MSVSQILDNTGVIKNQYLPGGPASNYVPYVGADEDVDLGTYNLLADNVVVANQVSSESLEITATASIHTLVVEGAGSSVNATNATILNDLTVNGIINSTTTLDAENITVNGTLDVVGESTFSNIVTIDSDLIVSTVTQLNQVTGDGAVVTVADTFTRNAQNVLLNSSPILFVVQVTVTYNESDNVNIVFPNVNGSPIANIQSKNIVMVGYHITDETDSSLFTAVSGSTYEGNEISYDTMIGCGIIKSAGVWKMVYQQNLSLYNNATVGVIASTSPELTFNLALAILP